MWVASQVVNAWSGPLAQEPAPDLAKYIGKKADDFYSLLVEESLNVGEIERDFRISFDGTVQSAEKSVLLGTLGKHYFHYQPWLPQVKSLECIATEHFTLEWERPDKWVVRDSKNDKLLDLDDEEEVSVHMLTKSGRLKRLEMQDEESKGVIICFGEVVVFVDFQNETALWFYPKRWAGAIDKGK